MGHLIKCCNHRIPNNILALIPSSFMVKRSRQTEDKSVQTENGPLFKIYQTCKEEEQKQEDMELSTSPDMMRSMALSPDKKATPFAKHQSIRSSTLTPSRPNTSRVEREMRPTLMSSLNKKRDYKPRASEYRSLHKKTPSQSVSRTNDKGVQTTLCLSVGSTLMCTLDREVEILQSKTEI